MSKFLGFLAESAEKQELNEAFNTEAYELTFGKKNAGDIYFTFIDEDGKEFRIQFYTPAGLGKNVRQVFIGQKKGSIYPDVITKFKNPLKVIASMIEATKQYLVTPIGRGIDGFAINFSKRALDRGLQLVPKIIRQSGLKQKLNVMDLTYSPDPSRGYVWVIRKGKDPAQVFDGPKMQGITWDDPDRVGDGNTADASNAGNSPEVAVDAPKKPATGWSTIIAPEGNPNIEYRDAKGMMLGGIGVSFTTQYVNGSMQFTPVYGEFMGSSKAVNFRNIDGKDIKRIAKDLKLPPIPDGQVQAFTKAAESWWASKGSYAPDISDTKWNALVDAMKKSYVGNSVKVVGGTAIGQVMKDGIKVIVGLIRNSEMVAMNLDAYDKDNKQVSLPVSSRSFPDVDVNNPGALTKVMNLAIDVVVEISSREQKFDFSQLKIPAGGKVTNSSSLGIAVTWSLATSTTISQDQAKGTIKFVTTPDGKPAFDMEIPSGNLRSIQLYLDGLPGLLDKIGVGNPTVPNLANLQDKMPSGATLNVIPGIPSEVTIDWSVALPKTAVKTEEISFRTGIRVDSRYAYITNYVLRNGQVINNPKSYNISIQGLNALAVLGNWLETQSALLQRYRWVISQFTDTNYNPSGSLPAITWKNDGEMYIDGQSAKRLSSSQVLGMMKQTGLSDAEWQAFAKASAQSDAAKKNTYDKDKITAWYSRGESYIISNITRGLEGVDVYFEAYSSTHSRETLPITVAKEVGIMTPLDLRNVLNQRVPVIFDMIDEPDPISNPGSLAVFANQIRDRAPETRDVEWYVSLQQQGNLLDVHWTLTFRRNTRAGAVQAYQSQVNSANNYVQAVANLAKTKGFNVQDPRIMTVAMGVEWDRNAMNNGDDAYSEYEQTIGGGVNILVK